MAMVAGLLAAICAGVYAAWIGWLVSSGRFRRSEDLRVHGSSGPTVRVILPTLGAVGCGWLTLHLSQRGHWSSLPAYLLLMAVGLALAAIDLDVHRLPDRLLVPASAVFVMLLAIEWDAGRLASAMLCGVVTGALFLMLALIVPGGLGLGDVKLAGLLGVALGRWGALVVVGGFFYAFLIGGVVAGSLILARRATRHTQIAFGPALLTGAWLALLGV